MPLTRAMKARAEHGLTGSDTDTFEQPVLGNVDSGSSKSSIQRASVVSDDEPQANTTNKKHQAVRRHGIRTSATWSSTPSSSRLRSSASIPMIAGVDEEEDIVIQGNDAVRFGRAGSLRSQLLLCLLLLSPLWISFAFLLASNSHANSSAHTGPITKSSNATASKVRNAPVPSLGAEDPVHELAPPCHVRGNPNGLLPCAMYVNSTKLLSVLSTRFEHFLEIDDDWFRWPGYPPVYWRHDPLFVQMLRMATDELSSLLAPTSARQEAYLFERRRINTGVSEHLRLLKNLTGLRSDILQSTSGWQELAHCKNISFRAEDGLHRLASAASTSLWCIWRPLITLAPQEILSSFKRRLRTDMDSLERTFQEFLDYALTYQTHTIHAVLGNVTLVVDQLAVVHELYIRDEVKLDIAQKLGPLLIWLRDVAARSYTTSVAVDVYLARLQLVLDMVPKIKAYTDPLLASLEDPSTPMERWAPTLLFCAELHDRFFTTLVNDWLPAMTHSMVQNRALNDFERCIVFDDGVSQRLSFAGKRKAQCDPSYILAARESSVKKGWPMDERGVGCVTHPLPLLSWWYEEWCYDGFARLLTDMSHVDGLLDPIVRPSTPFSGPSASGPSNRVPLERLWTNKTFSFDDVFGSDYILRAAEELGLTLPYE